MPMEATDFLTGEELLVIDLQKPLSSLNFSRRRKMKKLLHSIGLEKSDLKKVTITRLIPEMSEF